MKELAPIATIHDSVIQKYRVGATSALAIRELCRPEAKVAGLFGSGWQAQAHLECLLLVRPQVEEIRVYSPTPAHREAFAAEWTDRTGRRGVALDDPPAPPA